MGSNADKAHVEGPLQRVRDLAILKRKLTSGMSNVLIAQEFGTHPDTIKRALRRAANNDLVQKFEDELLSGLVPEALKTIKTAIANGNADIALEILKGAGIVKKQVDSKQKPAGEGEEESLEAYIRIKRTRAPADGNSGSEPADGQAAVSEISPGELGPARPEEGQTRLQQVDGLDWVAAVTSVADLGELGAIEGEIVGTPDGEGITE